MQKIKVIEYIHGMEDGGAETLVKDYALLINKEKFDLVLVLNRIYKDTANLRAVREANVPIVTIYPCWNVFMKAWHETMGWWYVPYRLKKIIKKEQAQVLHVHLALLKYVNRIGDALKGIKLFYTCHSIPKRYLGTEIPKEHQAAKQLLKQRGLQLIALHTEMAEEINRLFEIDNTIVIHNGVNFEKFMKAKITKEEKRKELGIPLDAFVLGHVGRFNPIKNHEFLVDVFREVANRKTNAYLLMVGAGDTRKIEKKLEDYGLSSRYKILSQRSDVHEIMRAMDVFVFPSHFEGLPLVLIEAQASGLKCVVANTVNKEVIRTEKAMVLALGNPAEWAGVILDENAKGHYCEGLNVYDMNQGIRELENIYYDISI